MDSNSTNKMQQFYDEYRNLTEQKWNSHKWTEQVSYQESYLDSESYTDYHDETRYGEESFNVFHEEHGSGGGGWNFLTFGITAIVKENSWKTHWLSINGSYRNLNIYDWKWSYSNGDNWDHDIYFTKEGSNSLKVETKLRYAYNRFDQAWLRYNVTVKYSYSEEVSETKYRNVTKYRTAYQSIPRDPTQPREYFEKMALKELYNKYGGCYEGCRFLVNA